MYPTKENRNQKYIKGVESDASIPRDLRNVTEVDGGIVNYVRRQMHCETVTRDVMRQAIAFEREMSKMQGW
jgi:hypothetical protein